MKWPSCDRPLNSEFSAHLFSIHRFNQQVSIAIRSIRLLQIDLIQCIYRCNSAFHIQYSAVKYVMYCAFKNIFISKHDSVRAYLVQVRHSKVSYTPFSTYHNYNCNFSFVYHLDSSRSLYPLHRCHISTNLGTHLAQ